MSIFDHPFLRIGPLSIGLRSWSITKSVPFVFGVHYSSGGVGMAILFFRFIWTRW